MSLETINLNDLQVENYNEVSSMPLISETEVDLELVEERRILEGSTTLVFTNDETVSYSPDSSENTEGFDVESEFTEDPTE